MAMLDAGEFLESTSQGLELKYQAEASLESLGYHSDAGKPRNRNRIPTPSRSSTEKYIVYPHPHQHPSPAPSFYSLFFSIMVPISTSPAPVFSPVPDLCPSSTLPALFASSLLFLISSLALLSSLHPIPRKYTSHNIG